MPTSKKTTTAKKATAKKTAEKSSGKHIKLTLVKSTVKTQPTHKQCVKGLGLRRLRHTVIVPDNACNRGMIRKVNYLLLVEEE